jgi:SAM-dependent methyltransferase
MSSAYGDFAHVYDGLMQDVDYEAFADFYEKLFSKVGKPVHTLLDLACGTGTLLSIMTDRGYELIGTDSSPDMLMEAMAKTAATEGVKPLLLNQDMAELDLYGTVDGAYCSLDGINYVEREKLPEVFHRVWLFLEPGGMFIFDVNSEHKFRTMDGETYIDESDDVFCVWRTEFDEADRSCFYGVDIFSRDGDVWQRSEEEHLEYAYSIEELTTALSGAGFCDVRFYGELTDRPPEDGEMRIFVSARKPE